MSTTRTPMHPAAKLLIAGLLAVAVLYVAGLAVFVLSGGPLADEHACSKGEAPANNRAGGSSCFKEGSDLPKGYTWDPRGNYAIP